MLYEYQCNICRNVFEEYRPAAQFDDPAKCPRCQHTDSRLLISGGSGFFGAKVENAEYNPGLGCVTYSKRHREEVAKRKGLVEIGNDIADPDRLIKEEIADREKRFERSWEQC